MFVREENIIIEVASSLYIFPFIIIVVSHTNIHAENIHKELFDKLKEMQKHS